MVYDEAISVSCDLCAELDCLLSFSEAATTFNFVRPRMSEENVIEIIQGRYVPCFVSQFRILIAF